MKATAKRSFRDQHRPAINAHSFARPLVITPWHKVYLPENLSHIHIAIAITSKAMDPHATDPSRPNTNLVNAMNHGIVRLTPNRQPTFADDERGIDNQLDRFETAPEPEQQPRPTQQAPPQSTARPVQIPGTQQSVEDPSRPPQSNARPVQIPGTQQFVEDSSQSTARRVQIPGTQHSVEDHSRLNLQRSNNSYISNFSTKSIPPEGSVLTGKQEHCM